MRKIQSSLQSIPFFIVFLSMYPVFFLWAVNFYEVKSFVVPGSLSIAVIFTAITFSICVICFRSIKKGSLIAFVILVLFFSYGHVFSYFDKKSLFGLVIGRHRLFIPLFFLAGIGCSYLLLRSKKNYQSTFYWLNIFSGILFSLVLVQIGYGYLSSYLMKPSQISEDSAKPINSPSASTTSNSPVNGRPDVYFIVLDGYNRADLLLEQGYDNSRFIKTLKEMGFIIPECGQSNYSYTPMSLSSTLNMDLLDPLLGENQKKLTFANRSTFFEPYIKQSLVRKKFHELGYKFVTGASYHFLDIQDSDVYYGADYQTTYISGDYLETLRFQELFIDTTFARTLSEWISSRPEDFKTIPIQVKLLLNPMSLDLDNEKFGDHHFLYYQMGLNTLNNLEITPKIPGNKFVYSHLLISHSPYLFSASGEFDNRDEISLESYFNQITFLNSRLPEILNSIIKQSKVPPVIVVQADHSRDVTTKNFQAYYLPGMKQEEMDKYFTNVNTFRLIFSKYFNESLPFVPNNSYIVANENPLEFKLVEPSCPLN